MRGSQIMGSSQGQSDSNSNRGIQTNNNMSLYYKHPVKMLNLSLILYLALGAFLFDALGEFHEPLKLTNSDGRGPKRQSVTELSELRLKSAQRMWNITNQLNILYESNWTKLVLDELVEFERQFIESLVVSEQVDAGGEQDEEEKGEEEEKEEKKKDQEKKDKEKKSNNKEEEKSNSSSGKRRTRSIKKSFIHSLATITTIGSPLSSPKSQMGKLATVLYGALGIPLLFCTIARTGNQLAKSTANSLLVIRHYCVSLPLHYICCSSSPYQCFRWLSWCCCCCCCSYMCCLKRKEKRKCCDKNRIPKLRLVEGELGADSHLRRHRRHRRRRRRRQFNKRSQQQQQQQQTAAGAKYLSSAAYVIGGDSNCLLANGGFGQQLNFKQVNTKGDNLESQQQKSVRFSNQQQQQQMQLQKLQPTQNDHEDSISNQIQLTEDKLQPEVEQSPGLFLTSLSVLSLYLSFGAFIYSKTQNTSLVDGVFVCYDLLSVSKLPNSFGLEFQSGAKTRESISTLYESIKATNKTNVQIHNHHQIHQEASLSLGFFELDPFVWQTLYLICGLNLVSMCSQFAQLWLSSASTVATTTSTDLDSDEDESSDGGFDEANLCNGGFSSSSFEASGGPQFANCCPQIETQIAPNSKQGDAMQSYMLQATLLAQPEAQTQLASGGQPIKSAIQQHQQQQQQQIDLAELFVVSQEASPIGIQYAGHHPTHPQVASDASFASDRSTTEPRGGSLCQLHQQTNATGVSVANTSGAIYGVGAQPPSYGIHHQMAPRGHKEHLYLTAATSDQCQILRNREEDEQEHEEDDYEMDRMLNTCINGNCQRSSGSSSVHLSHSANGYLSHQSNVVDAGFGHMNQQQLGSSSSARSSQAGRQLRLLDPTNGCEQDSSLNTIDTTTNSNTISSVSSRTVKLPQHIHIHNGIGFIIDDGTTNLDGNKQN